MESTWHKIGPRVFVPFRNVLMGFLPQGSPQKRGCQRDLWLTNWNQNTASALTNVKLPKLDLVLGAFLKSERVDNKNTRGKLCRDVFSWGFQSPGVSRCLGSLLWVRSRGGGAGQGLG